MIEIFAKFILMDGNGPFVWFCFIFFLFVLSINLLLALRRKRKVQNLIRNS